MFYFVKRLYFIFLNAQTCYIFKKLLFCLSSASSTEKTPDWSDEDTAGNPFAANGDGNPFEEEPASLVISVPVKALYDYEGQEQDELSFKAGSYLLQSTHTCGASFLD